MRTISQFATDDPKQLGTQLSKLEQNVVTETNSIRKDAALRPVPTDDDSVSPIKTFTVGQCARINTFLGAVTFNIAAPADRLPGEVLVLQKKGVNGFTAVGVNAKINGAASYTTGAIQVVFRFYFDGTDFWI